MRSNTQLLKKRQHALRAQAVTEPVEASNAAPGKTTPSWVKYQVLITRLGGLVYTHSLFKPKMKPKYPRGWGFIMTYTAASHEGAINTFWLHIKGAVMSCIFIYGQWFQERP